MRFLRTCLAVLLGLLLGAVLFRPNTAKAAGNVYVQSVDIGALSSIRGTTVVGFSCVGTGMSAACYIASQ